MKDKIKKVLMEYITKGDMDDNVSFDNYINSFAEALESELQSLQGEQESKEDCKCNHSNSIMLDRKMICTQCEYVIRDYKPK